MVTEGGGTATHARSELSEFPIETVNESRDQAASSDEDNIGEQTRADVEVARHDGLSSERRK